MARSGSTATIGILICGTMFIVIDAVLNANVGEYSWGVLTIIGGLMDLFAIIARP